MQVSNRDELIYALKNKKDDIEIKSEELEVITKSVLEDRATDVSLLTPNLFYPAIVNNIIIMEIMKKEAANYYSCLKSNGVFSLQRKYSDVSPKEIGTLKIMYVSDSETRTSFVDDNKIGHIREKDFEEWKNSNKIELDGDVDISVGTILMKHPFLPNTYIDLNTPADKIFKMKMEYLATVMQDLGIKSIEGQAHFISEEKRIISEKGEIGYKIIEIGEKYKSEQEHNYANKYKMNKTFLGDFSEESYEKAKKIAKETGLDKDLHLSQLIEQRNPNHINKELSDELETELSSELNDLTDIAFNLKIQGVSLNVNYNERLEIKKKIEFKLKINF